MAIRMGKPFRPLTAEEIDKLGGQLGVYQIADQAGRVLCIGYAGGRSRFGLRGELGAELSARGEGLLFRCEVTMQYLTRYKELVMVHRADHGDSPPEQAAKARVRGRLHPA
jgi:hypothetical protein